MSHKHKLCTSLSSSFHLFSLSLSTLSPYLLSLVLSSFLCWTISCPGTSFSPVAVSASFQMSRCIPGDSTSPLVSLPCVHVVIVSSPLCLFLSPICVNSVLELCLLCVCAVCPPGLWWRGGHMVQVLTVWQHLKLLNIFYNPQDPIQYLQSL